MVNKLWVLQEKDIHSLMLEQSEKGPANDDAEEEPESVHIDIFADMKDEPATSTAEPEPVLEPKAKKVKKPNFEGVLNKWFSNMFNEGIDD